MIRPTPSNDNPLRLASEASRGPVKAPSLSALAAEATWRKAFLASTTGESGAVVKAWTVADKSKFNAALGKTWQGKPEQLHEFVDWSVVNWTRLMSVTFGWMTKRLLPAMPELGFLLAHRERFLDAFNRNTIAADREKLTDFQQSEMHRLITERGYTRDEAFKATARNQAVGLIWEEIDREKREIADQRMTLKFQEQRLVRQFGNKPLPHRNAPAPRPVEPAPPAEPYDGPPLFDMPEWDENTRAPINLKPVAK